jgi:hypothetical protein
MLIHIHAQAQECWSRQATELRFGRGIEQKVTKTPKKDGIPDHPLFVSFVIFCELPCLG